MHSFNVEPTTAGEGVSGILTALGEARIEVRGVAVDIRDRASYILSVDGPGHRAEQILEIMGYRIRNTGSGGPAIA